MEWGGVGMGVELVHQVALYPGGKKELRLSEKLYLGGRRDRGS
jgi:hypothetical protein